MNILVIGKFYTEGFALHISETLKNLSLFENASYKIIKHYGLEKTPVQSASVYKKMRIMGKFTGKICDIASKFGHPPQFYLYTAFLRVIDTISAPMPDQWARIAMTVCEKPLQ